VKKPPALKKVDTTQWLRALSSGHSRITIERCGYREQRKVGIIDWRVIPEHIIHFVIQGGKEFRTDNARFRMEPGSLVWVSPGIRHVIRDIGTTLPVKSYFLRFRLFLDRKELTLNPPIFFQKNAWEVRSSFDQLVDEVRVPNPFHAERVRALILLLTSNVFSLLEKPQEPSTGFNTMQRLQLLRYVEHRIQGRITSNDLAQELRLCRDYFSRLFVRTFGTSARTWLKRERIRHAAQQLVESNLNVTEVAYQFGYKDIYLFSRQFRQVIGCSPSHYRRNQ
jgi:AraC-like DNA-binding protein